MNDIKQGDIIYFENKVTKLTEEIRAVIGPLVFMRAINKNGVGPTEGPFEIEDLITCGYKKYEN